MFQTRKALNSSKLSEIKKKKQKILKQKILIFLALFVFVFFGLSLFSKWEQINIKTVNIYGNKVIETEEISKVVYEALDGKYLYLFPKSNSLIYPSNAIKSNLSEKFKRIKNISISLDTKDIQTLNINLGERSPNYIWCGESIAIKTDVLNSNDASTSSLEDNACYFVDESGYIFDTAPYFSGDVYFKFYGPLQNIDSPPGNYFLRPDFVRTAEFKNILDQMELKPSVYNTLADGEAEIYLSSLIGKSLGPKIIFKSDADYMKLSENLQAALNAEPLKTDIKKKYNTLKYIDLRFDNKVYYKFE